MSGTGPVRAAAPGRLLVVAPHATRTGSTRVLVDLLAAAAPHLDREVAVLLQSSGPLAGDLQALGGPPRPDERPAAVLANTCLAADHLDGLDASIPTMVYVHETADVLRGLSPAAARGLRRADLVVGVSEAVAADLVAFGIDEARVAVLPPLVIAPALVASEVAAAVRADLRIGERDRLVVGCGEASERKGTDLFVETARHLADRPELHFAWIGRRLRSISRLLDHDVEASGLVGRITWTEEVPDAAPLLAAADVLVMTSRFDPQPLVPLEAAVQGCPTVGLGVGGVGELGEAGCAAVVPFPDTEALAARVVEVIDRPEVAAELVAASRRRLDERQGPAHVVPRFLELVGSLLAAGHSAGKASP